ncbi:MAG TPA: phage tail protein [Acidimicrobiales bacterium]|nr:phage tail protein [Acidimicrobiales bacterium]
MSDPTLDSVVSVYFSLEIDTADLGVFSACDGLGMEFQVTQREEGGGGIYVYQLPGRFKYTNLRVTRPVGPDTAKTMAWLSSMAGTMRPTTARLRALDPAGNTVFAWVLTGVVPARWTGPSFDASNPQAATETLELAYTSITVDPGT